MIVWIQDCLVQVGFDPSASRKIELASEEALVNIIRHGYKGNPGKIQIGVKAFPKSHVEITIKDQGPLFNPLEQDSTFNPSAPIEERREGGLGILFIKSYMDEVLYRREGDVNILTLVKKL